MQRGKKNDSDEEVTFEDEEHSGFGGNFEQKLAKVKKELKNCQKEKQEYLNGWQRAKADLINLKKEIEGRHELSLEKSKRDLLEKFIPVIDSFNMAFNGEAWEKVDEVWRTGVKQIHSQLLSIFSDMNVVEIIPKIGDNYNPIENEAVDMEEGNEKKDGKVAEVLQNGYKFNGQVIRPAKVKIFKFNK